MRVSSVDGLNQVPAAAWNRLAGSDNPFLRHEFLSALERHDCLHPYGWEPRHLLVHDDGERLVGACPLYLKHNSYGELVFDHAWAEAYHRRGLPYYPKLVSAIPYTPVTSQRLLYDPDADRESVTTQLIAAAVALAREQGYSSVHWLFPNEDDTAALAKRGMLQRSDTQFHWFNHDYQDFDHFLRQLSAAKRKKIRRERRRVHEAGVSMEIRDGNAMDDPLWTQLHRLYSSTFERKSGWPTLSLEFFREIGRTLPEQVICVLARHRGEVIAGTFNLRTADTFYGRHWGCHQAFHSLHFEACYYQPIDYCIRHGLSRCEAGAQGEHKLSRGFLPVATRSAHWIADERFRQAIDDYLQREHRATGDYREVLDEHSPFRQDDSNRTASA